MKAIRLFLVAVCLSVTAFVGCNCGEEPGDTDTDGGTDGGYAGNQVGNPGQTGDGGTQVTLTDGGTCYTAACGRTIYACGNCVDDDGDGLVDANDPNCLGPCHNLENNFAIGIPAATGGSCDSIDCYFDANAGSGNDNCVSSLKCDPNEPAGDLNGGTGSCDYSYDFGHQRCPTTQPTNKTPTCGQACQPITPNGCDCFGCCTVFLPGGSSRNVYLGSFEYNGDRVCDLASAGDATICRSCNKNPSCGSAANCGDPCIACLGKPATSTCTANQLCPSNPSKGCSPSIACPAGEYCLTGCCVATGGGAYE